MNNYHYWWFIIPIDWQVFFFIFLQTRQPFALSALDSSQATDALVTTMLHRTSPWRYKFHCFFLSFHFFPATRLVGLAEFCLTSYLFFCLFIYLFICLFVCLFGCLFICMFVCSFVRLFVYLYICIFVCLLICLFISMFVVLDWRIKSNKHVRHLIRLQVSRDSGPGGGDGGGDPDRSRAWRRLAVVKPLLAALHSLAWLRTNIRCDDTWWGTFFIHNSDHYQCSRQPGCC